MSGYLFLCAIAALWLLGGFFMDMYENDVFGDDDE